ncbi:hypothetical protein RRG08_012028, partial [Elysia crispata]
MLLENRKKHIVERRFIEKTRGKHEVSTIKKMKLEKEQVLARNTIYTFDLRAGSSAQHHFYIRPWSRFYRATPFLHLILEQEEVDACLEILYKFHLLALLIDFKKKKFPKGDQDVWQSGRVTEDVCGRVTEDVCGRVTEDVCGRVTEDVCGRVTE